MTLVCQAPSCEYEFHDTVLDPHEAIMEGFEGQLWSHNRKHPNGLGTQTFYFCSPECTVDYIESNHE